MKANNHLNRKSVGNLILYKSKNLYSLLFFSSVLLSILSCNKEANSEFTDSPILESYLNPGEYPSITITRQVPFSADVEYATDDIDNLTIQLTYNNEIHTFTPLGNGVYIDSSTIIQEDLTYYLSFQYNSKNVSCYTYLPSKPSNMALSEVEMYITKIDTASGPPSGPMTMPDPIQITWDNPDGSYYLILVENMEAVLDPIRDFGDNAPPGNRFKKSPTNLSSSEIRSMDFQYFGTHRIILYHVLPDYATLYDETNNSSQNLSNPSTSITNGYGIFTGLNSDTLFVEVKEQ